MLVDDYRGYVGWGRARGHDAMIVLQWMLENYPNDSASMIVDTMTLLKDGAFDWSWFFGKDVFPMQDLDAIPDYKVPYDFEHVVNVGQGKKGPCYLALIHTK